MDATDHRETTHTMAVTETIETTEVIKITSRANVTDSSAHVAKTKTF